MLECRVARVICTQEGFPYEPALPASIFTVLLTAQNSLSDLHFAHDPTVSSSTFLTWLGDPADLQ